MTPKELLLEQVKQSSNRKWYEQLSQILDSNGYPVGQPSEDVVLSEYAKQLLWKYNEEKYTNRNDYGPEHRTPGIEEYEEFAQIIVAVLVERQIMGRFGDVESEVSKIINKLKEL